MFANLIIFSFISFTFFFLSSKIAKNLKLIDTPNSRSFHKYPVPKIGGAVLGILIIFIVKFNNFDDQLEYILCYSFLITVIGLVDDKYNLKPHTKLTLIILPTIYLIFNGLTLKSLGNYNFIGDVNLGKFSIIFTLLCCLLIINAHNYCDGIDMLLPTIFISNITYLLFLNNENFYFYLSIILPIIIFILFNKEIGGLPKIFLGDSGSLTLGYIYGFIMIYLYNYKNVPPALLIWGPCFIIYEFISVSIYRIERKKKLFQGGLDHIHHCLQNYFKSNVIAVLTINLLNLFFILIGYNIYKYTNSLASLISFIIMFFLFYFIRKKFIKKYYRGVEQSGSSSGS
jgi:UDP-GlcNAc:undecaprenyl-phosphate GlcNAc-1-phosphate transferase